MVSRSKESVRACDFGGVGSKGLRGFHCFILLGQGCLAVCRHDMKSMDSAQILRGVS